MNNIDYKSYKKMPYQNNTPGLETRDVSWVVQRGEGENFHGVLATSSSSWTHLHHIFITSFSSSVGITDHEPDHEPHHEPHHGDPLESGYESGCAGAGQLSELGYDSLATKCR